MNDYSKKSAADQLKQCLKHLTSLALVTYASIAAAQGAASGVKSDTTTEFAAHHPVGSIHSVEEADSVLEEVKRERARIENQYSAQEQACNEKFFVTSCTERADERRRVALQELHRVEMDAATFKRQDRVKKRDEALAQKREKEDAQQPERAKHQQEAEVKQAKKLANTAAPKPAPAISEEESAAIAAERNARHQAKLGRLRDQEEQDTQKRAENVAAYQRKVEAAETHKNHVAARKAEKAAKAEKARKQKDALGNNLAP